ncbi:hypothetical protein T11_16295 [Trichinella zimbabwensis]|uniref:Uncharacterized protein n=1 Tax=Trichinella zimbabwensis TaxID=268475 RepID=A0A0V1GW19_9BILA|nr:hypothetical protein T11_16295 [Trichinella zimbabwensis]
MHGFSICFLLTITTDIQCYLSVAFTSEVMIVTIVSATTVRALRLYLADEFKVIHVTYVSGK